MKAEAIGAASAAVAPRDACRGGPLPAGEVVGPVVPRLAAREEAVRAAAAAVVADELKGGLCSPAGCTSHARHDEHHSVSCVA